MTTIKRFLTLSLIAALAVQVWGVPAYRGWQQGKLTDGTTVNVRLVGDEFYHHWETEDGKIATMLSNGKFEIRDEQAPSTEQVIKLRKAALARRSSGTIRKNYGAIQPTKLLVLLVNFSDKSMKSTHNKAFFENLLNGSFPSVQDYFKQSSGNTYIPEFDVFGPYTLSNNMAYYGGNDSNDDDMHPDQMVVDACALAYADGCNFSNYDINNDGKVDNIYVIYAGYGEAAGAPANTIWPHSWEIYSSNVTGTLKYNGKTLGHYACSAELSGKSGSNSDGVGTFAHEFSHVIGLPDYYDTNYGTNSDNGVTPGEWTLMDQGSYNGSGQYPPLYSIYDKYFMGWTTPKFLAKDEIKNVTMTTTWNDGYQITGGASIVACTNTKTVYYIENRQKSGYDQYLPGHGMVVWTVTYNGTRWNNNDLNNTAGTLRYTIVPADGKTSNYGKATDPFPGTSNKKTWTPFSGCALTEITESGGNISFSYNGGVPKLTWDYVLYGENCTYPEDGEITKGGALNLTITPSSGYTLADAACWDVQMGGTKLTYGTDFTYNSGTNTFSIASVTGDVEIIVEGGRTVNWNAQGSLYQTNVSVGNKITLPDAPANCSASRQFVGWCSNSTYKSADTPPTYAKTGDAYSVANYYAVYADVSGGGSADATYTFTSKSWEATEGDWTSGQDGTAYLNSGVQVTQTTTGANATCPTSYSNISSIVVSYCTNASKGAGSIKLSVNGTEVSESVTSTGGTTPRDLEFDFSETTPSGAPVITVNCGTNSIYVCGLTITYGSASYSGFSTDCTAPDPCALTSISLNTTGVTKAFTVGDAFNSDGLVVTANYSNCSSKTVTPNSVSTPDMSSTGNKTVTVSYTESAVTKTSTYNITVSAPTTYAIRFFDGATKLKEESLIMSAMATPPTVDDCEEYEFIGWYTTTLATDNTTSHTWVSDFTVTGAQDYYAVFRHSEGGSSAPMRKANAAVDDVLWAEDFSGYSANNVPSGSVANSHTGTTVYDNGSVTYACTLSGTKIYGDGGPNGNENILIAKGNGTFAVSGIPTGGATELTLTYAKSGGGTLGITVSSNASISGNTITVTSGTTVDITFTNTSSGSNLRFDDASVTVKTASGGGSSTTFYTTTKDCTIPTEVTVKFDANGGEGTMTDQTIDYNTATALKANTFERTGYSFLGWATSASGTQVYDDEEEVTLTKKVTTLYAVWEKNSWKVWFTTPSGATTVTANGVSTSPLTVEYGETVTIVITPDAEHVIGTVTATGGASLSGEDGTRTFTMPDNDVALSITMTPKPTYTINFINMGETISSQQVMEGQAAEKPANPTACEGYSFVGWWNDELAQDYTTAQTWITTFTASGNQNYYAVYSHTESGSGGSNTITLNASSDTSFPKDGITLSASSGVLNNGTDYRIYKGATLTITSSVGNMTSIAFTFDGSYNGGGWSTSYTPNSTTWTSPACTSGNSGKQARITQIVVTVGGGGSSTTTYTTDPTCTPCDNKVTLTKGGESHGTFTVDKADGAHNNCTSDFVVMVSNIVPADGYRFANVTATGGNNEVTGPDGSGNYTVTYAKGNNITTTVTANFEEIPSHTVTWHVNGDESTETYKEGESIIFPESATGCDDKEFMGWSAVPVPEQDEAPAYTTSALMGVSDVTYYAVFATASSGSGNTFDGTTGGSFKIYAQVDDTKHYANGTGSKISSTTNEAEATSYTFTKVTDGWTIQTGETYITYSGSTNLGTSGSAYIWELSSGVKGTWRFTSETSGRGWIYRAGQDVFGGYSTGNVTAGGNEYYDLEIGSGSGTTYSGYTTSCTTCENKVTLTKGDETNGTFTLNKANGEYNNCTSNFVVTVSNITPESGYYCTGVTATGGNSEVTGPDGSGNYTVTYEKGNAIESIITANFAPNPTNAIRFFNNGVQVGETQNLYEGQVATKPSPDPTACEGYTFVGWWTANLAEDNTTTYSWVTDFTVTGAQDYYAVYSKTTEGGGTNKTYTLVLNGNNFAGSYAERSSSATANEDGGSGTLDVNFTSNGVMKSSNSGNPIQFRKSGNGAGVLYNTTDLGTINSITYGDGSTNNIASTYKGTTAQPTSDGTGGYFKITNGASVSYITSITINFTKTTGSSTTYYTTNPDCCSEVVVPTVNATAKSTSATISWNNQVNAVNGYSVTVKEGNSVVYENNFAAGVTSCNVTGLSSSTEYNYTVVAKGETCNSSASGNFTTTACDDAPVLGVVTVTATTATLDWTCSAATATIKLYSDAECNNQEGSDYTSATSPYTIEHLTSETTYYFKVFTGSNCSSNVGSFTTEKLDLDVAEWQPDAVVISYNGDGELTLTTYTEETHGDPHANVADDIFFSKYYEAASNVKLLAIFNGTLNTIDLSNYQLAFVQTGAGTTRPDDEEDGSNKWDFKYSTFSEFIKKSGDHLTADELKLKSNEELILISYQDGSSADQAIIACAEENESSSKFSTYIRLSTPELKFNGDDAVALVNPEGDFIDLIGAGTKAGGITRSGASFVSVSSGTTDKNGFMDNPGGWYTTKGYQVTSGNAEEADYKLSTNRCLLIRRKHIKSGYDAVARNTEDFLTLGDYNYLGTDYEGEWKGVQIPGSTGSGAGITNSCAKFEEVGSYNYNEYYIEFEQDLVEQTFENYKSDPFDGTYVIPVTGLSDLACSNIRIELKDGEGNLILGKNIKVPIMVTGSMSTTDDIFHSNYKDADICRSCDLVIFDNAQLTKVTDGTANDVDAVRDVKVYPGGKLIVPGGTNYSVNSISFRREEDDVATADIRGNLNIRETGNYVFLDMRVDPTNWHYFSLPYDCNVNDITLSTGEPATLGTDYLIKWYNGEKRAATQSGGCWEMVASDATLKAGLGYIFSIPGDGKVMREFRFPMDNEVIAQEKADKMVNGVFSYGGDQDISIIRANHRGWNLLGNPYLMPYSSDITDPLMTGYIVPDYPTDPEEIWDGHYKFDPDPSTNLRYIVEPIDNGWSGYTQVTIASYEMKPFTSYFVQIGGNHPEDPQGINFHVASVSHSPVRRAPAEYEEVEDRHPVWCAVTLTNPKGEKDETTLLISDNFTDGYDMMDDLTKWRGTYYQYAQITTAPVLASRNNEGEMAFNALPDSSALAGVPLNYFAASQGFYTIAYDDKYDRDMEVKEVKLWDKTTNQWYNLMYEPYSFSTARTDNKDRFVLSVRVERKQNQTTTDLENVGTYKGDKPRKLLINGLLYIQRGKDVYDVTGKQLLNR